MSIGKRSIGSAAFSASRVPYENGLYVVGPFASRVSFGSQQRRALNLVWSVNEDYQRSGRAHGLEGMDVAVIGAGLAGLTTAISCAAHKAHVWILEKEGEELSQFSDASHRDIHPSINFWPQEALEATTFLPFFNWWQAPCNTVVGEIRSEWHKLSEHFASEIKGVFTQCEVARIHDRGDKWETELVPDSKSPPQQRLFDCVFVATGFGKELSAEGSGTKSYWNLKDDVIAPIRKLDSPPFKNYVVGGTGDGGIIEVLRLLFRNFRAGSVEANTGPILNSKDVEAEILRIESTARKQVADAILHENFPHDTNDCANQISKKIWGEYVALAQSDRLGKISINKILKTRTEVGKVTLLGLKDTPIEYHVSPYHKLLLAIAVVNGFVEYHKYDGEPTIRNGPVRTFEFEGEDPSIVQAKHLSLNVIHSISAKAPLDPAPPAKNSLKLRDCLYVSRHGYDSPIGELFADRSTWRDLILRRQALYADYDYLSFAQANFYAEACGYPSPAKPTLWSDWHIDMARTYFSQEHGVDVSNGFHEDRITTEYGEESVRKVAIYQLMIDGENYDGEKFRRTRKNLPKSFVGTAVRGEPLKVPSQTSREGHSGR
ncbi:FAD-binding protein [Hyphomonas sp.]|uniref:FAD-binding protein n=1 Tax=Hyphomonas sp. TaxID=87 RepID=UPI0025BEF1B2|nr:FAD-binding protein [Hyphomonas sp.]